MALFAVIWGMAVVLRPRAFWSGTLMGLTIMLLCPFFAGMGLFFSLRSRNSTRAMCWSLLVAIFLGGGYLMCTSPLMATLVKMRVINRHQEDVVLIGCASWLVAWPGSDPPRQQVHTSLYLAGVWSYVVLGVSLSFANVLMFDRLVGRPVRSRYRAGPADSIRPQPVGGEAERETAFATTGAPP